MYVKYIVVLLITVTLLMGTSAFAYVTDNGQAPTVTGFTQPQEIVTIYLKAVDRGELQVIKVTLDRSMIIPRHVEYVYMLDNPAPMLKVYSRLKQEMSLPENNDCWVKAVNSTLSVDGHILETAVHILPK